MAQTHTCHAIVLRTRAYGESDKIVTFLSREAGKLTGIAKGAKNSRRRFANCLDPFTRVRVHYRTRPGASLAFMESCDLLEPGGPLSEPTKFAYASYLVELVDLLTGEAHPVPEVYALLDEGLRSLTAGAATAALLRAYELQLLQRAGYEPQIRECSRCERLLQDNEEAFLDAAHSTVLCAVCSGRDPALHPVRGATLNLLDGLRRSSLGDAQAWPLAPEAAAEASGIVGRLLAQHLPRPPQSVKLIASLSA